MEHESCTVTDAPSTSQTEARQEGEIPEQPSLMLSPLRRTKLPAAKPVADGPSLFLSPLRKRKLGDADLTAHLRVLQWAK